MPHATTAVATMDVRPEDDDGLLTALWTCPASFLQPSASLHSESLAYIKKILDPLATDVASLQKQRRDGNRKKRKRSDVGLDEEVLQLRQVYTRGLSVKQVWEQARRVLEATCMEVEREIATQKARQHSPSPERFAGGGHGNDGVEDGDDERDGELDVVVVNNEDPEEDILNNEDASEDAQGLDSKEDIEAVDTTSESDQEEPATYVQDPNKLNDGFFSIDDFNKQTQFLESQDARGEDDNPSDEDEIDWDADPLTMPFHTPKAEVDGRGPGTNRLEAGDMSDAEDGPTFGDADLNTDDSDEDAVEQEDGALEGLNGLDNTNEIRYSDFFAPPPRQLSKSKRMRALPKTQPQPQLQARQDDGEDDLQRAIADVRRDLLDSGEEDSDLDSGSELEHKRPSSKNLSTHEKQRAAIAAEIRRLEAASVAKRDWTLSGEARAADRPLNSLIEEDMEFERVGKPVPVITAEVSEELEALIKRRVLAREFDEIIRRHPDTLGAASEARRGRIELDDTKPQSGLAEVYEQEHLKSTDPGYVDKRSAATKKQHQEISRLWKEVSSQLDLLSNLHFKPKRVEVEIKAVEDKPTISMEDARPAGVGVNAEESMLAPQEVYRPGEDARKGTGVVLRKSGASVSKEEMSREEKLRRRRREKERTKKSQGRASAASAGIGDADPKTFKTKKGSEQVNSDLLSELQKGNVKVVSKKGDLQDLGGKKGRGTAQAGDLAGGALKL